MKTIAETVERIQSGIDKLNRDIAKLRILYPVGEYDPSKFGNEITPELYNHLADTTPLEKSVTILQNAIDYLRQAEREAIDNVYYVHDDLADVCEKLNV
jgi:exonuclease VII small subunit